MADVLGHLRLDVIGPTNTTTGDLRKRDPGEACDLELECGGLHGSRKGTPVSDIMACLNVLRISVIILLIMKTNPGLPEPVPKCREWGLGGI
jgi:hypothetical protein